MITTQRNGFRYSRVDMVAIGAIAAHRFVGIDLDVCALGAPSLGPTNCEVAIGDCVSCVMTRSVTIEAGAALAFGQLVQSDAEGRAMVQAGTGVILGRVIGNATTAAGQFTEILLADLCQPPGA